MRHRLLCTWALVALGGTAHARLQAQIEEQPSPVIDWNAPHVDGEILYRLNPAVQAAERVRIADSVGAIADEDLWPGVIFQLTLPEGANLTQALIALNADPRVRYAEPNYLAHTTGVPNDPSFGQQWGWDQNNDADIDAPEAWDLATDASDVLVAIIDTGFDANHVDLAANIWTNPGEIPGNGIDDDGNGYVDDVHGYDFVNDDGDPDDDNSHGTHCSGTIGAVTDNGVGVAGACWSASMVAVKFLGSSGSGSYGDAVSSFAYCVAVGARLSNNSWAGGSYSQALYDAIDLAGDAGHLTVCAASNSGANSDVNPAYPAAFDLPEIVSVAATDSSDGLASFSNYGLVSVDLGAPGVGILSTTPGNGYSSYNGTSMACPHVCGVATMAFSLSGSSDPLEIKQLLLDGVDPIPSLQGRCVSEGRLNYAGPWA